MSIKINFTFSGDVGTPISYQDIVAMRDVVYLIDINRFDEEDQSRGFPAQEAFAFGNLVWPTSAV
jgi:hypothetical protein